MRMRLLMHAVLHTRCINLHNRFINLHTSCYILRAHRLVSALFVQAKARC